jgi:hypothetical protein
MNRKVHVRFLEGGKRVISSPYLTTNVRRIESNQVPGGYREYHISQFQTGEGD